MGGIDYVVIFGYLIFLLLVGVYFSRKASKDADHYFLGGRRLPWWCLGASGMSSNLDVAGTMTIVTLLYLFGLHGFFIEMRGGVVLPIAVFLAFMGKWHQRSQVMTTAEWMELRFGSDASGKLARTTAALTYVVITIGMVVFFLSAMGKFLAVFLPFTELQCQVGMLLVALGYTAMSGLYGVVWTDVFQAFLIGAAAIYVAVIGALEMGPELVAQWPGAQWNQAIPRWYDAGLTVSQGDSVLDYRWFGFF
ncbi:MAG: sodium:solute symporter, partial [Verrucomicrobiota bacterium]